MNPGKANSPSSVRVMRYLCDSDSIQRLVEELALVRSPLTSVASIWRSPARRSQCERAVTAIVLTDGVREWAVNTSSVI